MKNLQIKCDTPTSFTIVECILGKYFRKLDIKEMHSDCIDLNLYNNKFGRSFWVEEYDERWISCTAHEFIIAYNKMMNTPI